MNKFINMNKIYGQDEKKQNQENLCDKGYEVVVIKVIAQCDIYSNPL